MTSGGGMILISLGGNLPSPEHGPPRATLAAALARLPAHGVRVLERSQWYESVPMPVSDQPCYVNGVASVATSLDPAGLLAALLALEAEFGRVRTVRDAARVLDLDLLDYAGLVMAGPPILPHPRMHLRAFVLLPLREVAPSWVHPATGIAIDRLIEALPVRQAWPLPATEPG